MKKLQQIRGRIWLGRLKVTFSRVGSYVGYINFLMLVLTFYAITGHEYASLEVFLVVAIIGVVIVGMLDYFVMLPSEQAFGNEQVAKHQNPIYEKIKEIGKEIEKIKEELENKEK